MRAGRCAAAIAGAASVTFPNLGYRYDPGLMFSPDGAVRPFDEAGGLLKTSTRQTLNRRTKSARRYKHSP